MSVTVTKNNEDKVTEENLTINTTFSKTNSSSIIQSESLKDNVLVLKTGISGVEPFIVDFEGK